MVDSEILVKIKKGIRMYRGQGRGVCLLHSPYSHYARNNIRHLACIKGHCNINYILLYFYVPSATPKVVIINCNNYYYYYYYEGLHRTEPIYNLPSLTTCITAVLYAYTVYIYINAWIVFPRPLQYWFTKSEIVKS